MKDNFDIFNKIEMDFSEYEEIPFNEEEKSSLKKSLKKRIFVSKKLNKNIIAATLAIAIFGGGILSNDTVIASIKSNINNIGESLEKYISNDSNREVNLEPYTTVVGKTIYDKGISATLEEVIVDNDCIYVRSTFDYSNVKKGKRNDELYDYRIQPSFQIRVNGKHASGGWVSSNKVNDNVISYITGCFIEDFELSENSSDINVSIDHNKMYFQTFEKDTEKQISNRTIRGNWNFEFITNAENMINNSEVFNFNNEDNEVVLNDCKFNVRRISVNPISLVISYKISELKKETSPNFKVIDEFGNELSWKTTIENQDNSGKMEFRIDNESSKFTVIPGTSDYYGNYIYDEDKKIEINTK